MQNCLITAGNGKSVFNETSDYAKFLNVFIGLKYFQKRETRRVFKGESAQR